MKKLKILTVVVIVALAAVNVFISKKQTYSDVALLNLEALADDYEWTNPEIPWDPYPKPAQIGKKERCKLELGGGMFTSSIQYTCYDQFVCTTCTCTPHACGEVF